MKIDLKYDLADAHVHIGQDSIIGKRVSASNLLSYGYFSLIALFGQASAHFKQ